MPRISVFVGFSSYHLFTQEPEGTTQTCVLEDQASKFFEHGAGKLWNKIFRQFPYQK